jgi:prepilin-type N-terminal cleavage/methylation domain-containing protein
MPRRPFLKRRGFSLPETIMALVVMALAVGVFGAAFPSAGQAIARSKHIDMASDACQKQLDYYRQIGETSIELTYLPANTSTATVAFTPNGDLPGGGTGSVVFRRLDSSYNTTTADTGRLRVDASVSWTGVGSDRGTVTLSTLIVEHAQ